MNNTYRGTFDENSADWYKVTVNDLPFSPKPSLKLRNHSPTGFAWGYGGSGPAQLALAILLKETDKTYALEHYMDFKRDVIARLSKTFVLSSDDVQAWIQNDQSSKEKVSSV